jgi:uncharacterized protein HemX
LRDRLTAKERRKKKEKGVRGFKRDTIQVKGAEKFFQKENRQLEKARRRAARRANGRVRRLIYLVVALLIVGGFVAFARSQQTQITSLKTLRDAEIDSLRSRISELSTKLQESERQEQALKGSVSELEKQVEKEQAEKERIEALFRSRAAAKRKSAEGNGG